MVLLHSGALGGNVNEGTDTVAGAVSFGPAGVLNTPYTVMKFDEYDLRLTLGLVRSIANAPKIADGAR